MFEPSDSDIIARLNAKDATAMRLALMGFGLISLLALFFAGAFFTGHAALLESRTFQLFIAVAAGGVFLFALVRMARDAGPAIDVTDPAIVRKRIDAHHRSWRWVVVSNLFSAIGCVVAFAATASKATPAPRPYLILFGATTILIVLLNALVTAIGPGGFSPTLRQILNDEYVRALRARSARVGYGVMMAGCAASLLTGLWRPALALPALAWTLYAGFAIPALYYVIADWRAGRSEGA